MIIRKLGYWQQRRMCHHTSRVRFQPTKHMHTHIINTSTHISSIQAHTHHQYKHTHNAADESNMRITLHLSPHPTHSTPHTPHTPHSLVRYCCLQIDTNTRNLLSPNLQIFRLQIQLQLELTHASTDLILLTHTLLLPQLQGDVFHFIRLEEFIFLEHYEQFQLG
jgi:hypothetical protein